MMVYHQIFARKFSGIQREYIYTNATRSSMTQALTEEEEEDRRRLQELAFDRDHRRYRHPRDSLQCIHVIAVIAELA